ncbi:MAG: glycolate oxidase subunit GlcE, partial [Alphaproteobacteria bacterium]|nr:glycolate oxidase subunit GlcE [Alphaproteobacteria bacterium]
VRWAASEEAPLEVIGAGSKRAIGRPPTATHELELTGLSGIGLYEPNELVLGAGAGTPLSEIQAALAAENQLLAFEPPDLGLLLGDKEGAQTIGGIIACNLSGPRRIKAGAARDHFLGFQAVSGRGEAFKAGGRVVKNVTGYDMCKLLAGSYGTLAVMNEVTLKVLPAPAKTRTVLVFGLTDADAVKAMTAGLTSAHEVSGAAHLPQPAAETSGVDYVAKAAGAVTAVRVEGPQSSVKHRCAALRKTLGNFGETEELHGRNSATFWAEIGNVSAFSSDQDRLIWRLSVPPSEGPAVVAAVNKKILGQALYDWGGGLIWLAIEPRTNAGAPAIREAIAKSGGHATLIRAPRDMRASCEVFQPQEAGAGGLTKRLKESFDPRRILNPGRMYEGV